MGVENKTHLKTTRRKIKKNNLNEPPPIRVSIMNAQSDVNQIHFMFHFKWHISASADRMLNKRTPVRDKFACLFRNTGKILHGHMDILCL